MLVVVVVVVMDLVSCPVPPGQPWTLGPNGGVRVSRKRAFEAREREGNEKKRGGGREKEATGLD